METFGPYRHAATAENVQARERGKVLMQFANDRGALLLSTGNKTEMAVGYCTLYGDMAGGLAVISDIDKLEVYRLVRWRNRQGRRPVVPERVLRRAPSAELRPNQKDEDTLPPYKVLVPIANAFIEEGRGLRDITAMGYDRKTVAWVLNRLRANEFKRWQMPPGLRVTPRAFGIGWRYPITNRFRL
jgi:NAD+ synthase (glutamine-hydrolysing)